MMWVNYIGSNFHEFWSRCGSNYIHPDDEPFFVADKNLAKKVIGGHARVPAQFGVDQFIPCPFDGPLETARIVICLANPNYSNLDAASVNFTAVNQRCGTADLPKAWDAYYKTRIANPIGTTMDQLRRLVSVLNLCPYSSPYMEGAETRLAAGLPSVWAAQKHFREVLLPLASEDKIIIIFGRKHQLWGVHEGFASPNIVVSRENAISGRLPDAIGVQIRQWLVNKGLLSEHSDGDTRGHTLS